MLYFMATKSKGNEFFMDKIDIKILNKNPKTYDGKNIVVAGWVKSVRDSKTFGFIDLNDGSAFRGVQVIFNDQLDNFSEVAKLNIGSSIAVEGTVLLTPQNKQPFEIKASKVTILSATDSTYPIQKKRQSVEFLRSVAYLRPRTNLYNAVFRVRSEMTYAIHSFFKEKGFLYVHTPILTTSDCEGAGNLFRVTTQNIYNKCEVYEDGTAFKKSDELFGKEVFLTPTGQLEGESLALALGKVYTFGPTFRAENSNTTRHANEFWMIEPEVAFADLDDIIQLQKELMKYLINYLFENCPDELEFFNNFVDKTLIERLKVAKSSDYPQLTYTEAIEILKKNNDKFAYPVKWGSDIQTEHERYLAETIYKGPVFVTDYPKDIKAFYMKGNPDNKTVRACDLLMPGVGEVTGGSQREDNYDKLVAKIADFGLNKEDYWWYLNLRKYGSVEHSGFGIGFERLLMYLTGVSNIRDVLLFPRTPRGSF